ncbi:MAG: hypothetical protein CHACPFDD_03264 [Phycisphaerae bacterium]|nr:hypothetical protein [Phycisphaerae bacterium]
MLDAPTLSTRPLSADDLSFVRGELNRNWFSTEIWSRGVCFAADALPGFVAFHDDQPVGLVTIAALPGGEYEVVTLSAAVENRRVGTALLDAAVNYARECGARRLSLTTSNDNLRALGFYQRRGWRLVRVWVGEVDRCRLLKPGIPRMGMNRIPLHDEIELEFPLDDSVANAAPPR